MSRWILAAVLVTTVAGMVASMSTSYALQWRALRFTVDSLFLIALLMIVATPAAMQKPVKPPPPGSGRERAVRVLQLLGTIVFRFFTLVLATAILVGLLTAPSNNASIIVWRLCTAVSAVIVLNSRLLAAFWAGGPALRAISMGIATIEIVAFIATISIDIPAFLQTADLASGAVVAQLTSSDGAEVPHFVAAAVLHNRSTLLHVNGDRIAASPVVADLFHYLGSRPFGHALEGVVGMPFSHRSLDCAITANDDAPVSGYRSQKGVVDYVLPMYVQCSPDLAKLTAFVANLPGEATPAEAREDVRRCGSVVAGAAASARDALRGRPAARRRIADDFPPCR
ncbi:MAG: hypothetical protein JO029_13885 [Candidatus Eremiobacteraeota bacterium]|nr:hypothetical protein [Candidatus Eremiobacteraeota bacterium]